MVDEFSDLKRAVKARLDAANAKPTRPKPLPKPDKGVDLKNLSREERESLFFSAREKFVDFARKNAKPFEMTDHPAAIIAADVFGEENLFSHNDYNGSWLIVLAPELIQPPEWDYRLNSIIEDFTNAVKPGLLSLLSPDEFGKFTSTMNSETVERLKFSAEYKRCLSFWWIFWIRNGAIWIW